MALDLLTLVIIIIGSLIVIELFKHILFKKVYRFLLVGVVLLVILIIVSGYLASTDILKVDNKFVATGASILDGIKDNIGEDEIKNITSPIRRIDKNELRKLYK